MFASYYILILHIKRSYKKMGYTKAETFEPVLQQLSLYAKVLAHPARLEIIQYLANAGTCISGDIANAFPQLSRTTVSQHLQELKAMGIIQGEIDGVKVCYCLNYEVLNKVASAFNDYFKAIPPAKIDCCQ